MYMQIHKSIPEKNIYFNYSFYIFRLPCDAASILKNLKIDVLSELTF